MKLLILFSLLVQALAFAPLPRKPLRVSLSLSVFGTTTRAQEDAAATEHNSLDFLSTVEPFISGNNQLQKAAAGFATGAFSLVGAAFASDVEISDLPPPYVPVLFGIVVLGGVGLLTSSLGDVMTEEASLGLQSGARAKKEMERSRSSYFKKK